MSEATIFQNISQYQLSNFLLRTPCRWTQHSPRQCQYTCANTQDATSEISRIFLNSGKNLKLLHYRYQTGLSALSWIYHQENISYGDRTEGEKLLVTM
jgi:hypothetical protein